MKDFSLSQNLLDFKCFITDFVLDSGITESVLFVSLFNEIFLVKMKDSSLTGRSGDEIIAFCFLAFSKTEVIRLLF